MTAFFSFVQFKKMYKFPSKVPVNTVKSWIKFSTSEKVLFFFLFLFLIYFSPTYRLYEMLFVTRICPDLWCGSPNTKSCSRWSFLIIQSLICAVRCAHMALKAGVVLTIKICCFKEVATKLDVYLWSLSYHMNYHLCKIIATSVLNEQVKPNHTFIYLVFKYLWHASFFTNFPLRGP